MVTLAPEQLAAIDRESEIDTMFRNVPQRLVGEATAREALAGKALSYHVAFLDDMLRAILPDDLILLGAGTGIGKTQLALNIAASNAEAGKQVYFFALEAGKIEIERRLKFREVASICRARGIGVLNYVDWYLGRVPEGVHNVNREVDGILHRKYRTLRIAYPAVFDALDMARNVEALRDRADMIVIDHLHHVENDDANEARGLKKIVRTMRDTALIVGKPVMLVAQLRKRGAVKQIVPDLDDFHGSSDVVKIATHAVMLARAPRGTDEQPGMVRTLMHCPKDRRSGAQSLVALVEYDLAKSSYRDSYQLGRVSFAGDKWEPIDHEAPAWAKRHRTITRGAL